MKNIQTYKKFNESDSNIQLLKKIFDSYENEIDNFHKKREFNNVANSYFNLFNELNKYLKNNDDVKKLIQISGKLKSLNKVDDEFNSILSTLMSKKEQLKKQLFNSISNNNSSTDYKKDVKIKEMSKKYPNISTVDAKEISNELDRMCNKYPENKQLQELQNSWYEGDNKSSNYDFWDDKIREIFQK